jgi:hypothetical protein
MAFYSRSIQIDGILYKQISPNQWQNVNSGQIIDSTKMVIIINEFKKRQVTPVTPGGGASGACCEIPNMISGAFVCTDKDEGSCPGGCFKVNQTCNVTDESPEPCVDCVRCCYIADQYCVAKRPEQCVPVGNGGGTYFGSNGCTACKYGVCSSDQNNSTTNATERFYGSRGCTGTFIVGGGVSDFRTGVFCTGSDVGQTCFGPGMRYQDLTPVFIEGGTCADCIFGSCCTGGTCAGITSQSSCSLIGGVFFAGQTCSNLCDFGVFCQGLTTERTCIRTGYRGEALSDQFQSGATCAYCITGTCCVNGAAEINYRQTACSGYFLPNRFATDACATGSCCVGATCTENVFRYDCVGVFNAGMTCIACSNGACCLPGGGCTLTSMGTCMATGGTFFGGATCSACDTGVCCNNGTCTYQRRGNVCAGTFYAGTNCSSTPCEQGACCTGGNCISNTEAINCQNVNGTFFSGVTCIACATGANCLSDLEINGDRVCTPNQFFGDVIDGTFYQNQGCSACQNGVCCNQNGGGVAGIRGDCTAAGATFFAGQTLFFCDAGVFCTGSGVGQTCFGTGYRGQSLTNNFIKGASCSSCILGACCTGGTCLSGGLTSEFACNIAGGLFFAGSTCIACDYGVYCTGATCLSLGYRGQSLSNNFIKGATCASCVLGACCTGGTCSGGGQTSQAACNGIFFAGATCISCDYGVFCTGATCAQIGYRGQNISNNFIVGATCSSCILGACCTGGTCLGGGQTSQAACQAVSGIFYAGLTCSQCITGVCCTGGTCTDGGIVYAGQCPASVGNFIAGGTCSECSIGICCTGGTCTSGGVTSSSACSSIGGVFHPGQTLCSYCVDNVNCCVNGTHYYISRTACQATGGIVFEGASDSLVCELGVFCTGSTCAGISLFGFNLGTTFIIDGDCGDCIYGTCCNEDNVAFYTTENACSGIFYAGEYDPSICTQGLTFGICCNGSTCSSDVLEQDCTGYFISNDVAAANSLSCGSNACEMGICCSETGVTAATGGICLGVMRRAECALTGGDFFPSYMSSGEQTGVTCSNCIYTPMLASIVTEKIAANTNNNGKTTQFSGSITGFTGNEIQPRREVESVNNTYLTYRDSILYGIAGSTTHVFRLTRANNKGNSQIFQLLAQNFDDAGGTGWKVWYSGATLSSAGITSGSSALTGSYDYSPAFDLGVTNANNKIMGHIPGKGLRDIFEVPRYARLVLGYNNPSDDFHDTTLVYRLLEGNVSSNTSNIVWALDDATKHAQLQLNVHNTFPAVTPFQETLSDTEYSSPILVQFFAENPLNHRVRPVGSCCVGATCIGIVTKDHCMTRGGTFAENGRCTRCYPSLVFGNCCVGGTHAGYTSLAACNSLSGTFFEGSTFDAETCVYGTICTEDRQCYQGISFAYYGSYSSINNKFFIEQEFGSTLGCLACDAGLCCVGATCMGKIPKTQCDALGGSLYYGENTCETNCELGVCCEIGGTCGTYTNRADCYGINQVFVAGATLGATCSACSSLLTLTSSGPGVTYTMVLNKGTTYGTFQDGSYWVQETSDLRLLKIKMKYVNAANTSTFEYAANTRISGITLNPNGYKGSVYVHGCAKNPTPLSYVDKTAGVVGATTSTKQKFISICYDDYPQGWGGPFALNSTDVPDNYNGFDLQGFLNIMNSLKYSGITLSASDVVMASTSNFDITKSNVYPSNAGGYPYQVVRTRANTLAYGILNCLSAANSSLAGSTLCFRPPNTWPQELGSEKPIYPVSLIDSRVPGTSGNTLINLTTSSSDKNLKYNPNTAKTCSQVSEFGDGVDYPITTPIWGMDGAKSSISPYGEQYILPLLTLLRTIHATGANTSTITFDQRKNGLARIVQYGIDAWGAHRAFCLNLSSGAGQKAGRTRSWIPLAGYYLGVSAMYDPELTMLSDNDRMNHLISNYYTSSPAITPGGTCSTMAEWRKFRYGDTGSQNNSEGLRRFLARIMSHEVNTMVEYINDPSNLVRHYAYPGILYKDALISGFKTGGQTGITYYNSLRTITFTDTYRDIPVYGNFGTIRWGDGTTSSNPFPTRFNTHFGEGGSIEGMWLRVESGR